MAPITKTSKDSILIDRFQAAFLRAEVTSDRKHQVAARPRVVHPVAVARDIEAAAFPAAGNVDDL